MDDKTRKARGLAHDLTLSDDTSVTVADIDRWSDYEVFDWLEEGWDMEWNGEDWVEADYVREGEDWTEGCAPLGFPQDRSNGEEVMP